MFDSKLDKFMCFVCLYGLAFIFGTLHGVAAGTPFIAAATLALGMVVRDKP